MQDAETLIRKIHAEAEQSSTELRFVRTCGLKDEIRQGDVYLYRLPGEPEHQAALETRQLAPGETAGSRHVVAGEATLYARGSVDRLDGPVVHVRERSVIEHPEHAHISIPPGWYEVRYQRDFSREGTYRVVD